MIELDEKKRIIQEFVPGKQVTLAHVIANPTEDLYLKLGLIDASGAIGIFTITPSEAAMIAADVATKYGPNVFHRLCADRASTARWSSPRRWWRAVTDGADGGYEYTCGGYEGLCASAPITNDRLMQWRRKETHYPGCGRSTGAQNNKHGSHEEINHEDTAVTHMTPDRYRLSTK